MEDIIEVNEDNYDFADKAYTFGLGIYRDTKLKVYEDSFERAFDICMDWVINNKPEFLCDDEVKEAYNEAIQNGLTEEQAFEESIVDVTCLSDGHYILSDDWLFLDEEDIT